MLTLKDALQQYVSCLTAWIHYRFQCIYTFIIIMHQYNTAHKVFTYYMPPGIKALLLSIRHSNTNIPASVHDRLYDNTSLRLIWYCYVPCSKVSQPCPPHGVHTLGTVTGQCIYQCVNPMLTLLRHAKSIAYF